MREERVSRSEFGTVVVLGMIAACAIAAYLLVHVLEVGWFRERLLSDQRWTRAIGMLPIAVPAYLIGAALFYNRYP